MGYKNPVSAILSVILPPNQRCIKGTFNLCYLLREKNLSTGKRGNNALKINVFQTRGV